MSPVLIGADIRGYFAALGISIKDWARAEASVRCFADPDGHTHGDSDPSCSINLEHGAWNCHGCGADGGPYDAATARGYSPSEAIDLMVAYGLTNHRPYSNRRRVGAAATPRSSHRAVVTDDPRQALIVTESDVAAWHRALRNDSERLDRLARTRAWSCDVVDELQLGLHRGRVAIPIRAGDGSIQGMLRYQPDSGRPGPKMLASPGSRLGLIPHPSVERSPRVILTEGPPDMIAARSIGLPAIAIPGDHAWKPDWAHLFLGRDVTIVVDSDTKGREAGMRIQKDLENLTRRVTVLDLAPERADGYDLTDWLLTAEQKELAWQ